MRSRFPPWERDRAPLRVQRRPVDAPTDPAVLLSGLRQQNHVVALLGRWHDMTPLLAWDPLVVLAEDEDPFAAVDALPTDDLAQQGRRFGGGWIGAFGYQLAGQLEDVGRAPRRPVPQPVHRLAFYDRVLIRRGGQWWLEELAGLLPDSERSARRAAFLEVLRNLPGRAAGSYAIGDFTSNPGDESHLEGVRQVQQAISAGDLFQANLTQRLEASFDGDPIDLFLRGWRQLAPAYAAYLGWPGAEVSSFSPELFLRRSGRRVTTSPIKGTAPLGSSPETLENSAKDRAENVMIVDLMRNDLARVSQPGSVQVPALNRVEDHAVRHLVSDVIGELRPEIGDGALLRETFPPGSVTGAPKIASLRLLNALEATGRELYTGVIGYIGPAAGLELSVAIRTFEHAPGRVWLGVGGGITTLSDPVAELAECRHKADPLLAAVGSRWPDSDPSSKPVALRDTATLGRSVVVTTSRPAPRDSMARVRRALRAGAHDSPRVLVVDNYDSFVHNLVHLLEQAGATTTVVRNDALRVDQVERLRGAGDLTHLMLSPGPAAPTDAGITVGLIRRLGPTTPILGVCLGHQAIGAAFGAAVVRARHVVHGRAEPITHDGLGVLAHLPARPSVARYHSLAIDPRTLPPWLQATSWSADGELMGLRHRLYSHVEGLQWHPESILTEHGLTVLQTFLCQRVVATHPPLVRRSEPA